MGDPRDGGSQGWGIPGMGDPRDGGSQGWGIPGMGDPRDGGSQGWRILGMGNPRHGEEVEDVDERLESMVVGIEYDVVSILTIIRIYIISLFGGRFFITLR